MLHFYCRTHALVPVLAVLASFVPFSGLGQKGHADLITVSNAGFEDTSVGTIFNEFSFGIPAGWTLYDPQGITNGGAGPQFYLGTLNPSPSVSFPNGAPEGQRVGIAYNTAVTGGIGEYGLQQTLTETLQSNLRYTLSVAVGNIASGPASNGTFFNLQGFPGYRMELLAGGVVLAYDNNLLGQTIPEGMFATRNLEFIANDSHAQLGQALSIRLVNLNQIDGLYPAADLEVDFDDVRLSVNSVPEPSALWLMTLIAVLISSSRRRFRNLHCFAS